MVDTDDTRRTTDDGRRTTPQVWHKLPTGELKKLPQNHNLIHGLKQTLDNIPSIHNFMTSASEHASNNFVILCGM